MTHVDSVLMVLVDVGSGSGKIRKTLGAMAAGYQLPVVNALMKFAILFMHKGVAAEQALEGTVFTREGEPFDVILEVFLLCELLATFLTVKLAIIFAFFAEGKRFCLS